MLTLSVLSPGASVLVAGADVLHEAGTGAALAFLLGGLLTLVFTFAQAELGLSFPLAGGGYATIGNTLGPRGGFVQFGVNLFQTPVFIAVSATGVGLYLHVLVPALPATATAVASLGLATAIAVLNIRTGAALTGTFLVIELATLLLIAFLGFAHPVQSLGAIFIVPIVFSGGTPAHLTLPALGLAVAAASWATSGAGQAIYFSEEMLAPASVGRLVIAIVLMTVLFEFVPVFGIVVGTQNAAGVFSSEAPFHGFSRRAGIAADRHTCDRRHHCRALQRAGIGHHVLRSFRLQLGAGPDLERVHQPFTGPRKFPLRVALGRDDRCSHIGDRLLLSRPVETHRPRLGLRDRAMGAAQSGGHHRSPPRPDRRTRHLSRAALPAYPHPQLGWGKCARNHCLERRRERATGRHRRPDRDPAVAAVPPLRARSRRCPLDRLGCAGTTTVSGTRCAENRR